MKKPSESINTETVISPRTNRSFFLCGLCASVVYFLFATFEEVGSRNQNARGSRGKMAAHHHRDSLSRKVPMWYRAVVTILMLITTTILAQFLGGGGNL